MVAGSSAKFRGVKGGEESSYDISASREKWQGVVFYPMDWEEDALHLILAFSSMAHKFKSASCCVFGCSSDPLASHAAWTRSEFGRGQDIPLLSDPSGNLASRFDMFDSEEMVAHQGVVVLDSRGEEQLVVCSSLEPKELASYCLGLVQQAGKESKQAAKKTAKGFGKAAPVVEEPIAQEETLPKLPPGAKAINQFWSKVVHRFEEQEKKQVPLVRAPVRLQIAEIGEEQSGGGGKAPARPRRSWGPPPAPKCPVCAQSVFPLDQVFGADRQAFHRNCIHCQRRGCPNTLTKRGMHRSGGLIICSSCENENHPMEYAPPTYKETAEEEADRKAREKLKEEAPGKLMKEMKVLMNTVHGGREEVRPSRVINKLEGFEEYCSKG